MSQQFRRIVPPEYYATHFSSIIFKTTFVNCIHRALTLRKWKQHQSGTWHLQWCEKDKVNEAFNQGISGNQKFNHFRLFNQLCQKDMLNKNVRKYKRELAKKKILEEKEWNFLPLTFSLPSEYSMFVEQFKKKGGFWIMKPTSRSQGAGIFIVDRLSQVAPYKTKPVQNTDTRETKPIKKKQLNKESDQSGSESDEDDKKDNEKIEEEPTNEKYIIQKYLDEPLLFGKKKFDIRLYVLCTDYKNLTVWLYRSGFARFTHQPYYKQEIQNLTGHLTNVQIQKHSDNYDTVRGGKWLLREFKHYLISKYSRPAVDKCFTEVKDIILRSLRSVQKSILPSKHGFELYGYDFMVDQELKPWLIEVNGGPSMTANTDFDCQLKCGLIDDVLSIIDLEGICEGNQMIIGGFDLIMKKDVPVKEHESSDYGCMLGAKNERKKVMKEIALKFMQRKQLQKEMKQTQKQKQNKKRPKEEKKKDSKLLPNFYYEKKREVDNETMFQLKRQYEYFEQEKKEFIPLKLY